MKSIFKASTILALTMPFMALAQTAGGALGGTIPGSRSGNSQNITTWIGTIGGWVGQLAIILIGVAILVFFWGIVKYVMAGADEEKRAAGRSLMIYGIIGLFVMVAVWGLVYFLAGVLGIGVGGGTAVPGIPGNPADMQT